MAERSEHLHEMIRQRIVSSISVKEQLLGDEVQLSLCADVARALIKAYRNEKKLLIFGNGGSAADAQHIAAELVGRFYLERRALPAQALTANASIMSAIGNDYAFDRVFGRQVEAQGQGGDVAIGISTSGNSRNVVEGLRAARQGQLVTVGLTGQGGGEIKGVADYCVCVPSQDTPRIQEAHLLVGHIWAELIEHALFGPIGSAS